MSTREIDRALTFHEGIATRDAALATRFVSPRGFVEHDPRVADGVDGLRAWVDALPVTDDCLRVARAYADDRFVFTQSAGTLVVPGMFFDVFRFEDGAIAEHWHFATPAAPPNASGHTQIDGPTEPRPGEETAASKAFLRRYYEKFHIGDDHSGYADYFDGGRCVRHEPEVEDGVPAFIRDVEASASRRTIDELRLLLGDHDFVFIVAAGTLDGHPCAWVDLYRVENGKIAEHWGFPETLPPRADWKNGNGPM